MQNYHGFIGARLVLGALEAGEFDLRYHSFVRCLLILLRCHTWDRVRLVLLVSIIPQMPAFQLIITSYMRHELVSRVGLYASVAAVA